VKVQRYDQGRFDAGTLKRDAVGALRFDARLTRTGVFAYRMPDGSVRRELRHPDHVFKPDSLKSLALATLTLRHPQEGMVRGDNLGPSPPTRGSPFTL